MTKACIVALILVLSGCGKSQGQLDKELMWKAQAQHCIDAGGIPIRSAWDSELKTCEFPPAHLYKANK